MPRISIKPRVVPLQKRAWTVKDWGAETSLSRPTIYRLMYAGAVKFVMIGRARRITTSPSDFLRSLQDADAA
jgi:hypothetical protein